MKMYKYFNHIILFILLGIAEFIYVKNVIITIFLLVWYLIFRIIDDITEYFWSLDFLNDDSKTEDNNAIIHNKENNSDEKN